MSTIKARVNPQKNIVVKEYKVNASTIRIGDLVDIDASGAEDGAMLLYNGNTSKFEATKDLDSENTNINGGHY